MTNALDPAMADPWALLRLAIGGPLHPGGVEATRALLDRAEVGPGMRILDIGCGAGEALSLARDRGAWAVGLDRQPAGDDVIRGDLEALPLDESSLDVVLAECVLCLADDFERAAVEARRVLRPAGRLALSDVVVDDTRPDLPAPLARALCLDTARARRDLQVAIAAAGFEVESSVDHRDDLLAMRDRVADRVDYERLLPAFGERGRTLLDGLERLEAAVEDGRVGYVSLVARPST